MKRKSKIEKWILDPSFDYAEPWFYSHTYSLRCELGIGEAGGNIGKRRADGAEEIFDVVSTLEWTPCFWSTPWKDPTLAEGTPKPNPS